MRKPVGWLLVALVLVGGALLWSLRPGAGSGVPKAPVEPAKRPAAPRPPAGEAAAPSRKPPQDSGALERDLAVADLRRQLLEGELAAIRERSAQIRKDLEWRNSHPSEARDKPVVAGNEEVRVQMSVMGLVSVSDVGALSDLLGLDPAAAQELDRIHRDLKGRLDTRAADADLQEERRSVFQEWQKALDEHLSDAQRTRYAKYRMGGHLFPANR